MNAWNVKTLLITYTLWDGFGYSSMLIHWPISIVTSSFTPETIEDGLMKRPTTRTRSENHEKPVRLQQDIQKSKPIYQLAECIPSLFIWSLKMQFKFSMKSSRRTNSRIIIWYHIHFYLELRANLLLYSNKIEHDVYRIRWVRNNI